MSKTAKVLFAIFNVILLSCNYIFVAFFPKGLLFGWLPAHLAFFYGSIIVASIVWGVYYNKFFNTQKHVDDMYGEE